MHFSKFVIGLTLLLADAQARELIRSLSKGSSSSKSGKQPSTSKSGKQPSTSKSGKQPSTSSTSSPSTSSPSTSSPSTSSPSTSSPSTSPTRKPEGNNGEDVAAVDVFADDKCEEYCSGYFDTCSSWNIYLNPKKSSTAVSSITTNEPELPREENLKSVADAYGECLTTCMKWPRPMDPMKYTKLDPPLEKFGSRLAGDTFWCRDTHLHIATSSINQAAFHCSHSNNPSLGICRDALIDGFTPYEWLREGADTQHRIPFCDLASNDKVADCTMGGVTETNIASVLAMLPGTVEMLFLNGNKISTLANGVFKNLRNPSNLKALYVNTCGITSMEQNALEGLENLVIFSAYENKVLSLHPDFLIHTKKLVDFAMAINPELFGGAGGNKFPTGFLQHTPELEMLNMYQCASLTQFDAGTFDKNPKLRVMSFVNNQGITSFPNGLFDNLTGLEHFHFFGNQITSFPDNFFGPWAKKIISLAMWNCPIDTFSTVGLENLESIEQAIFHTEPQAPPKVGPTFSNFKDVFDILRAINPLVTFTYGIATGSVLAAPEA